MKVSTPALKRLQGTMAACESEFQNWRPHFQELAQYILPRRYIWLAERAALSPNTSGQQRSRASRSRNDKIIDPSGTKALRVLAAGMLNGITSPTRPWLRLRQAGFPQDGEVPLEHQNYFDEVTRRMLLVMAESNFYNAMAVLYLDFCCFGTAPMLIYEDFDEVIRCYNSPMGEYRLAQDGRRMISTYTRSFHMTLQQMIDRFGEENISERLQPKIKEGGQALQTSYVICHLIEPNTDDREESLPKKFKYREFYWEANESTGKMLDISGYREKPGVFPRWEVTGNDTYGVCPAMDALPDIIQLQHENLRKAQAIDKMVNPPVVMETFLRNNPSALLPGGQTTAPSGASFGAKPIYTVQPPLGEMTADISSIQLRIAETFHNDLFRMISNLDTVRTATEIDARKEEKLVLLGSVLERFENEALDPAIRRIFNIMERKDLLPEPPPDLDPGDLEIEYVSVLSDAQRAVGTASIERFVQFIGEIAASNPDVMAVANFDELIRDYADRLNVPSKALNPREVAQQQLEQNQELRNARESALVGKDLTDATRNLSATEVGGGNSALQMMLSG